MKRERIGFFGLLFLIVVGAGLWAWLWWNFRPFATPSHDITRNQAQIGKILATAGWVSPKLPGPKLYMISYRSCPDRIRFERATFPRLQAAGVDTRVIMIARADPRQRARAKSTAPERATVAELWVNRDFWKLYQRWLGTALTPPDAWTAPAIVPADGDATRTAAGSRTGPQAGERPQNSLLAANGVKFAAHPTLIWWTKAGGYHARLRLRKGPDLLPTSKRRSGPRRIHMILPACPPTPSFAPRLRREGGGEADG